MSNTFPKDRVINFSDAIYAIAITLLVLEIKIPNLEEVKQLGIPGVLRQRIPNFIGFLVSFFVTALFWKGHLQLFTRVTTVTNRLFWLNLIQLFFVVLMPFSTSLYSYYAGSNASFSFYCMNLAGIGLMGYWMTQYIYSNEPDNSTDTKLARWEKQRALIAPVVFILSIPTVWLSPWLGRILFVLIFIIQAIGERRIKKQMVN